MREPKQPLDLVLKFRLLSAAVVFQFQPGE